MQIALAAYCQCEKIKSGLIWISQTSAMITDLKGAERKGAVSLLKIWVQMILDETTLSAGITKDNRWHEVGKDINMALVMITSGVAQETSFHLTRALSKVTRLGNEAMQAMKKYFPFKPA